MKYPQVVSMPSAVSNWLDEQLEARGIDAVVYTRYILSLLHSHTVDVLYPEEDLQFSHSKKEVRRSNRGFIGSHRSSSDWWRHAHADAERIKRSAAVECLLSASEQNCEIESLVDELCEKLKEVNSESSTFPTYPFPAGEEVITDTSETKETKKITPQELAEKYYAAFPPLCPRSPLTESKLLSLIPKWRNATASTSPVKKKSAKKVGKQLWFYGNQSRIKESNDMMKARAQNKQRFNCLARTKNNFRNTNNALNNWDFNNFFTTNNKKLTSFKHKEDQAEVQQETVDQCVDINKDIWSNEEENMYEDLPVDIKDLLDSPTPHDDTVEMMNIANMRDTGKRRFIPYGTNIMGSIWSTDQDITYDNNFNSAVDSSGHTPNEPTLDYKFSAISIDNPAFEYDDWPPANSSAENETNSLFENSKKCRRSLFLDGFHSLPGDWSSVVRENREKEDEKECFENEKLLNHLAFSLMKLNHDKEKSCFAEVTSRSVIQAPSYNPFGKASNATFSFNSKFIYGESSDKEDLLTSDRTHFKPIREHAENGVGQHSKYADGTTFYISNNLEKIDYKRSESGSMFVENEYGQSKKYYKLKMGATSPDPEFVLKFSICQNDKAAQTDEFYLDFDSLENCKYDSMMNISVTPTSIADESQQVCTCTCEDTRKTSASNMENSVSCPLHSSVARPESTLSEVVWKYEENKCEKCNEKDIASTWSRSCGGREWPVAKGQLDSDWDENGLRSIWSGGEVCQKCLSLNGSDLPRPAPNHQLREDISLDGEQLLSDLSSIQKTYMDDLPVMAERSLDISDLIASTLVSASKERKRRHSLIVDAVDPWCFASRLEEDCLQQMAALPALRAVTL